VEKMPNLQDLLEKYHKGTLSNDEKTLLDEWFEGLGKNHVPDILTAYDKTEMKNHLLEFIDKRKEKSSVEVFRFSPESLSESPTKHHQAFPEKKTFKFVCRLAASLLLIALSGYGAFTWYGKAQMEKFVITEMVTDNKIQKILLSDGSIVWLKNNSSLTYPKNFRNEGDRIVTLQGEALFEVAKNPARPFIVYTGEIATKVLGTSFNVKASVDNVEVTVLTGRVSVTSTTDKNGVVVLPEQKAVYHVLKKKLSKVETRQEPPDALVSGTEYDMNFNDTRMGEIISRIEGKFNVRMSRKQNGKSNLKV
jgi:transmembrane sensor